MRQRAQGRHLYELTSLHPSTPSALSHKKFGVDAPHSMGRYKEETGGLLSQVEDF